MKLNKAEFLDDLKCKLSSLPKEEREKTVNYYTEMIDDRIESGMGEEEAVAQMESTQTIAERLIPEESKNKTKSIFWNFFLEILFITILRKGLIIYKIKYVAKNQYWL